MGNKGSRDSFTVTGIRTAYPDDASERFPVASVCVPKDESFVYACRDKLLDIWDASKFDVLGSLPGHLEQVTSVCASPDKRIIISASADGGIRMWAKPNFGNWGCIDTVKDVHAGWAWSLAWLANVGFVSVGTDGQLAIWELESNGKLKSLVLNCGVHSKSATGVCVLAQRLKVYIITVSNDASVVVSELSFAPSGEYELEVIKRLTGHFGEVLAVDSYSYPNSNGGYFVTCGEDKTVRIWNLADVVATASSGSSAAPHVTYTCDGGIVSCVKISPDGRFIVAAGLETITIFRSPIPSLGVEPCKIERAKLKLGSAIRSIVWCNLNTVLYAGLDNGSIAAISTPPAYHRAKLLYTT